MGLRWTGKDWKSDNKVAAGGSAVTGTVVVPADVRTFTGTLTGNTAFTLPAAEPGKQIDFVLTQGTGGSKLATFTGAKAAGAAVAALSTAAGAVDVVNVRSYDGVTYVATLTAKGVA